MSATFRPGDLVFWREDDGVSLGTVVSSGISDAGSDVARVRWDEDEETHVQHAEQLAALDYAAVAREAAAAGDWEICSIAERCAEGAGDEGDVNECIRAARAALASLAS